MSERIIFVFGSNLAGAHGAGAALWAAKHKGAIYGQGIGLMGDSYGIPTKDKRIRTLPLDQIQVYVKDFLEFARNNPNLKFQLTPIGCGLAGYKPFQIAPMFNGVSSNVIVPEEFKPYLKISITDRIQNYLCSGGLFNPELMEHEKVRDLLLDARYYIELLESQILKAKNEREN